MIISLIKNKEYTHFFKEKSQKNLHKSLYFNKKQNN